MENEKPDARDDVLDKQPQNTKRSRAETWGAVLTLKSTKKEDEIITD